MSVVGRGLPSLISIVAIIVTALTGTSARAEDLDQGKSGATLFAANCAGCHRSARGLAKGRLSFTLSYYLRQHYTSSAASAASLTAYLQSVDIPRGKPQQATRKARAPANPTTSAVAPGLRPPATVPGQ
jgi:mono/diheme cytochrome c family protein